VQAPALVEETEQMRGYSPLMVGKKSAQVICFGVCCAREVGSLELDVQLLAEPVNVTHHLIHWQALTAHVVEVGDCGDVVTPDLHHLALEAMKVRSVFLMVEISRMLMCCDSPFGHQLVAKRVHEDKVRSSDAPHPLRDTLVSSRASWGHSMATCPSHVDRLWHHSFRLLMVVLESFTEADQLEQCMMSL
jgi:hypothetical protein